MSANYVLVKAYSSDNLDRSTNWHNLIPVQYTGTGVWLLNIMSRTVYSLDFLFG
jgi:hypothetical protein